FLSCEDVQRLLGERMYRRSVRSDMSQDLELIDISDIKVIEYDVRKASDSRESLVMSWKFYFGGEND
ncbi:MAG: iron ABC transporter substrate-binding protein, partial [Lachnospiraceae bacterium]|nr:iron ABC transporter substrate-binding protein [Lachnospiraceae bacterium]